MSQKTANDVLRVLSGTPRKFTCTVHLPSGEKIEFQADRPPCVEWSNEDRGLWLFNTGEYGKSNPIMRWIDGSILLCEENPK